jgi:hypothetical protein
MLPRFAVLFVLALPAMLHGQATVTSLSSSANPAVFGHPVTLTAVVSPNPGSGTVTFYSGVNVLETEPLTAGHATFTTTLLPFGAQSLKARFDGNSTYSLSTSPALSQTVNALEGYGFQVASGFGENQYTVVVDDFNSDGKQDLAMGTATGVEVLLGNGDGTFQAPVSYAFFTGPNGAMSTAAGDFNGDGKSDLAVSFGEGVFVLLGNGDGTFQPAEQTATGYSVTNALTVGDFNGDGKADLAFGAYTAGDTGEVVVMLGNGDGTFAQPLLLTTLYAVAPSLALGDFNGDGKADLAYCTIGAVGVLLGKGDGTFTAGGTYSPPGGVGIAVGDFNADGKLDVAAAVGNENEYLNVYLGNGDGTLQPPSFLELPNSPNFIVVADFNGDGNADLAGVGYFYYPPPSFPVLLGKGDGTFQAPINYGIPAYGPMVVGDFNGDGRADVASIDLVVLGLGPPTTTGLESSPNPSTYAGNVTLTASVSPATVTGSVTFYDGSTALGASPLSSGVASLGVTTLAVGTHSLTAMYGGDSNEGSSTSPVVTQTVTVRPTTTTLTSSPNPSNYGQSVTLTATVSPSAATGTVTFYNQSTVLGTGTLSGGTAILSLSNFVVGTFWLTAAYGGDTNDGVSNSSVLTQTVNALTTSTILTSSLNPSVFGQTITLTATVSPVTATGTVTFYNGSTALGTGSLSGGKATLSLSTLAKGTHSLTATYSGDKYDLPSTSSVLSQVVSLAISSTILTSSPNPSVFRQTVTLTAAVSPATATGTVTFYRGTTSLGTGTLSGGVATLGLSSLSVGSHVLTANYGGDESDSSSKSPSVTQVVENTTSTVLTSSPNPSNVGQNVTLTATVLPSTATGKVTFYHGSTAMGTASLSGGVAIFATSTLSAGAHALTATYGGDAADAPSTSAVVNQVVK